MCNWRARVSLCAEQETGSGVQRWPICGNPEVVVAITGHVLEWATSNGQPGAGRSETDTMHSLTPNYLITSMFLQYTDKNTWLNYADLHNACIKYTDIGIKWYAIWRKSSPSFQSDSVSLCCMMSCAMLKSWHKTASFATIPQCNRNVYAPFYRLFW